MKSDLEHVNLTYRGFLLTHNVKRGTRDICSFKGTSALVVLEPRYRKVFNWTVKLFFMSSHGWEFPVGQIGRAKFPIRVSWGVVPSDKVRPTTTIDELHLIAIV